MNKYKIFTLYYFGKAHQNKYRKFLSGLSSSGNLKGYHEMETD